KEKIKLVVPDGELLNRVNYWCDRQNLLKPYRECTFCSVCETCDFALRDDAKYYVDQFFMKDKALIKEKKVLFEGLSVHHSGGYLHRAACQMEVPYLDPKSMCFSPDIKERPENNTKEAAFRFCEDMRNKGYTFVYDPEIIVKWK
ncbi:MAG: hypothetical protein IK088_07270, partial [Lachnospiraceae bacterium]|nr:hypothetical protein [Lachnospiraceae bacterium]